MKYKLVLLMILIAMSSLTGAGCVRTAATWQPGQIIIESTTTTPATIDPDYSAGMLRLTPDQKGTIIPVSYAIADSGDGINCKIIFDQLSAGGSGAVTWTLKNISHVDGEYNARASITINDVEPNGSSSNDINIKLKRNNAYVLGDAESYARIVELVPVLNSQLGNQYGGEIITYELLWQNNARASQGTTPGKVTFSVTFTLLESQSNH